MSSLRGCTIINIHNKDMGLHGLASSPNKVCRRGEDVDTDTELVVQDFGR